MATRTLLVEDERHSLERLKDVLSTHPELEVVGEASNGPSAIALIDQLKPDLIFLDIQMPGCTGFEVLSRIQHRPMVIFMTAYEQFALKAFDENAVDYVLKPSSRERITQAVEKALQRQRPLDAQLLALLQGATQRRTYLKRFMVRTGDDLVILPEEDVLWIRAEDKYVFLSTADREYLTDFTLKELEQSLDPEVFIRIHKSHMVAIRAIRKVSRWLQGEYTVELSDPAGTKLKLGRAYQEAFRLKLNWK